MTELKNRGVAYAPITVVYGLKGFPEAISAVFPRGAGPDAHRAPDPLLDGVCLLEGA